MLPDQGEGKEGREEVQTPRQGALVGRPRYRSVRGRVVSGSPSRPKLSQKEAAMTKKMPRGTYWDEDARQYVEPTDSDWSAEEYERVVGESWEDE